MAGNKVRLTVLNVMADEDIVKSLDTQKEWGIRDLDLKDRIFGKNIMDITDDEARQLTDMAAERDQSVYCLSTGLFLDDVEKGEEYYKENHLARVERAIELACILKPRFIRLLAARSTQRTEFSHCVDYLHPNYPWLIPMYGLAVDHIAAAGFEVCIENEVHGCIFYKPEEVLDFLGLMDREQVCFTYDLQNMWEAGGIYPTLETYGELKNVIGYVHLKGGMAEEEGGRLKWKSSLEDATWPVKEVMEQVVADGTSPVVCLNPSHGEIKPDYDMDDIVKRDIDYLRRAVARVE